MSMVWLDARRAIHMALCAVVAWLALVLALPGATFATSMSYRLMAALAPEQAWSGVFACVAVVGVLGLAARSRVLLLAGVLVLSTTHGVVALCLVVANPLSIATGAYGVLAGLGYYLAWRQCRDAL